MSSFRQVQRQAGGSKVSYLDSTTPITGAKVFTFDVVDDVTFTTLTKVDGTEAIVNLSSMPALGAGKIISLPANAANITIASGSILAYE